MVGLGRASVGRVGVGSDRVVSGRVRVELWLGWVGPLSDQGVVSQFGVESGWVDPTRLDPKPTDHTLIRQRPDPTQPQLETEMTRPNPSQNSCPLALKPKENILRLYLTTSGGHWRLYSCASCTCFPCCRQVRPGATAFHFSTSSTYIF